MAKAINSLNFDNNTYVFTVPYGSCSTAAGTAAKTVSVDNFSLETGAKVAVKFTVTNTAGSPTLNVNSTGAKAIYYNGAAITAGYLKANKVYEFIYNGTQWDFVGDIDTNTAYTFNGAVSTIKDSNLTASRALVSDSSGKVAVSAVTSTELGYLDGVTSAIQSQIDGKAASSHNHAASNITSGTISTARLPAASGTQAGITLVYPAASCTTFSSDSGTVTPAAVQKGAKMFAITRPSSSTNKAITRYSNTTGDVQDSKIIIEDVTNTKDSSKEAQVIAIPAEGNKKMVYGYCTDQVDGTSFIGGVFDASATSYPYASGLAIGGTSGNLLWKGSRVIDASNISEYANKYTLPNATSSTLGGVKVGSNITVSSGTISLTKANVTAALGYTPPTSDTNTTYSQATSSTLGLVKIGYTESGKNYPVELNSSGQMYVNVPWTDNNTTYSAGTGISISSNKISLASTYAGGTAVTLNNASKAASTASFYAPTESGSSTDFLAGGTTPTWKPRNQVTASLYNLTNSTSASLYATSSSVLDFKPDSTSFTFNLGNSSYRWSNVYSKAGNFSDAMTLGSTVAITGVTTIKARIEPNKDKNVNLGTSNLKWLNVYCQTASMNTSDRKEKKDITSIDDRYIQLFDLLEPVAYQFIDGTSGRTHTGFIAQDVEDAMEKVRLKSTDLAFFCKDIKTEAIFDENGHHIDDKEVYDEDGNPVYVYSLRYSEYIAIMAEKMKRMEAQYNSKLEELEKRLEAFEV